MKHTTGYTSKCRNCNITLEDENFMIRGFNPINFGKLIVNCPKCNSKYLMQSKDEFFTIKEWEFYTRLIFSMIRWLFLLLLVIVWFENSTLYSIFIISFIAIYPIIFILRWNKAIKESKERLNDKQYIIDLLNIKLINIDMLNNFYNECILTEETYNYIINYALTKNQ